MALGSSWPSSPSATHFQPHVTASLCLARCLCGHEVQQLWELIWWEKQVVLPPACSLWLWMQTCQHCPGHQPRHWRATWGTMVCTSHRPVEARVSAERSQQRPGVCTAFSAFACRDWRSFNIRVLYLAQLYSTSTFSIQCSWGCAHLKNGKRGCAQ